MIFFASSLLFGIVATWALNSAFLCSRIGVVGVPSVVITSLGDCLVVDSSSGKSKEKTPIVTPIIPIPIATKIQLCFILEQLLCSANEAHT